MVNRFGVLLRDARRRAGLTQEELAARSGVGVRTIRRLETGSGTNPRIGTVTLLADALEVTPAERRDLLAAADGEHPPTPEPSQPPDPAPAACSRPTARPCCASSAPSHCFWHSSSPPSASPCPTQ